MVHGVERIDKDALKAAAKITKEEAETAAKIAKEVRETNLRDSSSAEYLEDDP